MRFSLYLHLGTVNNFQNNQKPQPYTLEMLGKAFLKSSTKPPFLDCSHFFWCLSFYFSKCCLQGSDIAWRVSKKLSFKLKLTELQVLRTSTHWELVNPSSTSFQFNTSHKEMQDSSFPLSMPAHKSLARAVCIISQHYSWTADVPVKVFDLIIQVWFHQLQPLG